MANPVCTRDSLIAGYACYQNLNPRDQLAVKVYLKAQELAAIGGEDYTAELGPGGALVEDASAFSTMAPWQIALSHLTVLTNNAEAAGADISDDIDVIASEIECLKNFNEKMLNQMDLLLSCQLGVSKDYPQ